MSDDPVFALVQGRPITEDLQLVFGKWGEVVGIVVQDGGLIEVHYRGVDAPISYLPVFKIENETERTTH